MGAEGRGSSGRGEMWLGRACFNQRAQVAINRRAVSTAPLFVVLSIDVSRTSGQGREAVKGIEIREQGESEKSASKRKEVVYNW